MSAAAFGSLHCMSLELAHRDKFQPAFTCLKSGDKRTFSPEAFDRTVANDP